MCTPGVCPGQVTNSTQIEQPEQSLVYLLLGIFLACNILGLALTAAILPGLDKRLVRVKQLWFLGSENLQNVYEYMFWCKAHIDTYNDFFLP